MYIPWIAQHIVKTQADYEWEKKYYPGAPDLVHINLQGVAIGNGVIDSATQDGTYAEYAYSHGLIPLEAKEFVDAQFRACQNKVFTRRPRTITRGEMSDCDMLSLVLEIAGNPNEYVSMEAPATQNRAWHLITLPPWTTDTTRTRSSTTTTWYGLTARACFRRRGRPSPP